MNRLSGALCAAAVLLFGATAQAQTVRLAWDANTEPDVAGYTVVYGTSSRNYTGSLAVGRTPEAAITGLTVGRRYYFAVRARSSAGTQSGLSNEVSTVVQVTPPPLVSPYQLFWRNTTTGVASRWYLNGLSQLRGEAIGPGPVTDQGWQIVGAGDFNRDGENDVVWQHTDGRLSVWLMRGPTLLSGMSMTPASIDPLWRIVAIADMDRDGHVDLLWQHRGQGYVAVWFMRGTVLRDGQLLDPGQVPALQWQIVGAGDFDGDGDADLLWRHNTEGHLALWIMAGARQIHGVSLTPSRVADTDWKVVSVADVNGDRRADIIWQHDDGRLSAWTMNGWIMVRGDLLNPAQVPDVTWRIATGR
jgi:hypothetical protein